MKTKKISILHIDYDDLNNSFGPGGQAVLTRELYKRLKKDFKVTVLTGNYPGAKNNIEIEGVLYKRMGIGNFGSAISLLSFQALIPFAIWKMQNKFDLIIEFFTAPFSGSLGFLTVKKPYLVVQTFLGAKELGKKYRLPFYLLENFVLKKVKNFLVPTEYIKNKIKDLNPAANVIVLPYGYDHSLRNVKKKENKYVLFMGRIDIYNKGIDTLVAAWSVIVNKYPDLKLYIVGSGKPGDEKKVKMLISQQKLEDSIHIFGRQGGQEKIKFLANCLFAVIPSRFETFCISALETISIGKPLVISNIEGMSWIPDICALRFKTGDKDSLIRACKKLISNKIKRRELAASGKKFAKSYTWKKLTSQYRDIITNFMSHSPDQVCHA